MTTKARLHRLIDELPESSLQEAESLLEDLRGNDSSSTGEMVDEEALSKEDLVAIRDGMEAIGRGDFVNVEDYERRRPR